MNGNVFFVIACVCVRILKKTPGEHKILTSKCIPGGYFNDIGFTYIVK